MERREALASIFSTMLFGVYARQEESYHYDWTDNAIKKYGGPYTDNSEHKGNLVGGRHNHVTCDGVEFIHVTRCQTGENGWVEFIPDFSQIEIYNNWSGKWELVTEQWFKDNGRWNIVDPKFGKKWGEERVVRRVIKGHVKYWMDDK